eukprot:CAMPEP_0203993604 /NCGR_PEP_ID=MMETSP0360-20130528/10863_1 /ASSEMBLY_ACC=CAM_ASM_000342 /TAXON_ID=268821 /ORGANISM="Scrippsiella Hangoei, Strain SHTV-5" /LENGTH=56 /DNA_ID=CAMNT_0050934079 /DNA_START=49 /DNA_END=215 /DNA_ORIENTATION=-
MSGADAWPQNVIGDNTKAGDCAGNRMAVESKDMAEASVAERAWLTGEPVYTAQVPT